MRGPAPRAAMRFSTRALAPSAAAPVEQLLARRNVVDHGGRQPRAQGGGQRELVARLDVKRSASGVPSEMRRRRPAHELVHRGQLGADLGRLRTGRLDRALGLAAGGAGSIGRLPPAAVERRTALLGGRLELGHACPRGAQLLLEPLQLARQRAPRGRRRAPPAPARSPRSGPAGAPPRRPARRRPPPAARAPRPGAAAARAARAPPRPARAPAPAASRSARRRPRRVQPRLQPLALARLRRERLLGLLAPLRHLAEQPLRLVALGARGPRALLGLGQRQPGARGRRRATASSAPRASGARAARAARPPRPGASAAAAASAPRAPRRARATRFSSVRSSFSCARRRRLRCLPSPAASSISSRRSRGRDRTICSTLPCETTECISLPSPESESTSITSTSRQRAPLRRYSPSPSRSSLRTIEISEKSMVERAVAVVDHDLDLGRVRALHAVRRPRRSRPSSPARAPPAATARRAPTARRR